MRASGSRSAAVMVMDHDEPELVIDSFRGGARGVFCRRSPLKSLTKCISTVHSGQFWINNDQLAFLLELITRLKPLQVARSRDLKLLTRREAEVVHRVAQGMKNADIARELHLTEHTVRNYLFRVFEKLGLSSRVELTLYALSRQADA
jgi:DNA-binding NarL/FixJ family response regulator